MKVVNLAKYVDSPEKVEEVRPAHRQYMAELLDKGQLIVGGPYEDDSGALFIYDVDSLSDAEDIVSADPYKTSGVWESYELKPWQVIKAEPAPNWY
ncbi:YciI family protein [Streptomyces shenzhenensis]|uniref:YciI family protein n=1 Tax=Streptomyces shenzhenensis TaxID=943815 RepID=UPI003D8CDBE7